MKRILAALLMLAASSNAAAWGNIGLPNPVTVVIHAVGGYAIAAIADHYGHGDKGIAAATLVGVAKEVSDINFNIPDMLGWSAGAYLYRLGKENPHWCFEAPDARELHWYMPAYRVCK